MQTVELTDIANANILHRRAQKEHAQYMAELAARLRVLDDGEGEPVLDAREGIEELALGVDVHRVRVELRADLHHRRCARKQSAGVSKRAGVVPADAVKGASALSPIVLVMSW